MKELHRTNNLPEIAWLQSILDAQGIESVVLDGDTAASYGGALIQRRVMVLAEDYEEARRVFVQAKSQI